MQEDELYSRSHDCGDSFRLLLLLGRRSNPQRRAQNKLATIRCTPLSCRNTRLKFLPGRIWTRTAKTVSSATPPGTWQCSPAFRKRVWEKEVKKMVDAYGAKIPDAEQKEIVDYLVAVRGASESK